MKYLFTVIVLLSLLSFMSYDGRLDRALEIPPDAEVPEDSGYTLQRFVRVQPMQFSLDSLPDYSIPTLSPVDNPVISSKYGKRKHPILKRYKMHTGIDLEGEFGTPVKAAAYGIVVKTKLLYSKKGYGKRVILKHADGYKTLYAHLSRVDVEVGDVVVAGQVIGRIGNSGFSRGAHLHYEVSHYGAKKDPALYL